MARPRITRPPRNDPRMNMAFYGDNLAFCREMAWRNRQSITQYVNQLIAQEKEKHDPTEWNRQEGEES